MATRKTGWTLLLVALLFSLVTPVTQARAQEVSAAAISDTAPSRACSPATLKGNYGVLEQGTIVGQLPGFPPPPFPVVNSATATYDGTGNFSGTYTLSVGGGIVPGTFTGTYIVNPDCTYSDEFTPLPDLVVHHAGTISGIGIWQRIDYIYTDAGVVISGTARPTPPGGCSLASLKGTYAHFGQGTLTGPLPGFPPPPVLWDHSGTVTFDGKGSFTGEGMESVDGVTVPLTFTGTYTVNHDCSTSAVIHTSLGLVLHEAGTTSGVGIFQEYYGIVTDAGWVFVDGLKKQ
jgi:hypothetical protein